MKEHFHFITFKVPKYTLRLYTLRNVWRCNQVSIWRAVLISSPNLITKSSDRLLRLLTDSWLTSDQLLTDSWMIPDWVLIDFWLTPDWFSKTSDRLKLNPETEIGDDTGSQFGELYESALQIWLTSETCQTPDRLLTDTWQTLTYSWHNTDWLLTESQCTHKF